MFQLHSPPMSRPSWAPNALTWGTTCTRRAGSGLAVQARVSLWRSWVIAGSRPRGSLLMKSSSPGRCLCHEGARRCTCLAGSRTSLVCCRLRSTMNPHIYKVGTTLELGMTSIYPGGGTQIQRGGAPALRISRKKGSFFKTFTCPRFCKRRVLFCSQVRSMGVKIPLQSTKYTRLWRRVTPEVTGLPSLLQPLAAAKQAEDYKILS